MSELTDKESNDMSPRGSISTSKPELNCIKQLIQETVMMFKLGTFKNDILNKRIDYLSRYFIFCHRKSQDSENDFEEILKMFKSHPDIILMNHNFKLLNSLRNDKFFIKSKLSKIFLPKLLSINFFTTLKELNIFFILKILSSKSVLLTLYL